MENQYYENKVFIGKGNLQKFTQDYEMLNNVDGQFATASQLFLSNEQLEKGEEGKYDKWVSKSAEFTNTYEWIIYYKVKPKPNPGSSKAYEGLIE